MRTDLPSPHQVVQACHAAIEAARFLLPRHLPHPHLVVCGLPDQRRLFQCMDHLRRRGVSSRPFYEPDRGDELTAVATEPVFGDRRKLFRRYHCLDRPGFA
ncbi:MAG TPA: hypothetical protein VJ739_14640 [Gemmataceae bacterium]|nr:hypothetical protein [Gemmataceae bacterium]